MKIVLDTNVLVSGIFWGGTPQKILELWNKRKIELLASGAILNEYLRTIHRLADKAARPDLYRSWALLLPPRLKLVIVKKSFRICRDASDDMFIDCAITGKSHYIVTGDRDLLVLKQVMNVQIINASQFLRRC